MPDKSNYERKIELVNQMPRDVGDFSETRKGIHVMQGTPVQPEPADSPQASAGPAPSGVTAPDWDPPPNYEG